MKTTIRTTIFILAAMTAFVACADKKDINKTENEMLSFDTWMKLYVNIDPVNPVAEKFDGYYIQWIERTSATTPEKLSSSDWMELNYTGTTLPDKYMEGNGNVFMTRDSMVAKQENTFSTYTHYVPQRIQYSSRSQYGGIPEGLQRALTRIYKGDSVRVYMPASMATILSAFTATNGYGGHYSSSSAFPLIIDLRLSNIFPNPESDNNLKPMVWEADSINKYAASEWGMTAKDTLHKNFYFQIFYNKPIAELDSIKKDTTVRLWYVGKFLDGFVFDTNIDSIGRRVRRNTTAYDTLKYTLKTSTFIPAFDSVFNKDTIVYDCHFRMVFSSKYGYGKTLKSSNAPSTIIQPYSPLIFDVWVEAKVKKEEVVTP